MRGPRLDYAGASADWLAEWQLEGLGNGGSTAETIADSLEALAKWHQPEKIYHPFCGVGRWATEVNERFPVADYLGVDISEPSIQIASVQCPRPRTRFVVGDAIDHWFDDGRADTVLLTFEALNYLRPHEGDVLFDNLVGRRSLRAVVIDIRDRWPISGFRASMGMRGPLTAGSRGVVACIGRSVRDARRNRIAEVEYCVGVSRIGVRFIRGSVYHWPLSQVDRRMGAGGYRRVADWPTNASGVSHLYLRWKEI